MALTPPSSIAPATVAVAGTVDVDIVGDTFGALPVTGPLTAAELAAAEPLDVTVSGTVDTGLDVSDLATEDTLSDALGALNDVALTAILQRDTIPSE